MSNHEIKIAVEKLQIWLRKLEDGNRVNRKHDLMLCGCDDCELFRRVNAALCSMYEIQDLIYRNSAEGTR